MTRYVPNALTLSRLVMAIAMFALMASYQAADRAGPPETAQAAARLLDIALGVFILAGITDILDGWLARKLGAASALGRISDPFIDKVLVCGAFVYFAGDSFVVADAGGRLVNVTGVATWMAVVIFARELLVTGVRGYSERQGKAFTTTVFGKAKMGLQSLTIGWIFFVVAHGAGWGHWARTLTDVLIWATVLLTLASALVYVGRTRRLLSDEPTPSQGEAAGE